MMQSRFKTLSSMPVMVLLAVSFLHAAPILAQDDPVVESAWPSSALQGTSDLSVEILGQNFGRGAIVRFLVNCDAVPDPRPSYCDAPAPGVSVGQAKAKGSTKLNVKVDVAEDAYVGDLDVEVELYGRKGKGTTMFRVESGSVTKGECSLEFEAVFDDDSNEYGLRSDGVDVDGDGIVSYPAGGGPGFRLDTNGSMQLERSGDDRKIMVDFAAVHGCDVNDPDNPVVATGFCFSLKGSDIRIEHQVQDRPGLCSLDWGAAASNGSDSMQQVVVVSFLADDGGLLIDPDRKGKGPEPLTLNYGCQGGQLGTDFFNLAWQATVTRHSEWEWSIAGTTACLHTQLGVLWDDAGGGPVPIQMPFRIRITDVNKPAEP